ncbi:scyllo-inositol 2-dehydrogenase (NADP+) [Rhodanobacter sp. ANJX3]|uniref:oxidoreductase n=1 Tax=Rhodanobacter sp. ANJX3 TaxID=2723083 RepID=UPI00160D8D44|nr:oxidoreductase [Rhodanobacter sp. ANJX3]MBB5357361.1 scyllo-inositol 2-dehydrogenase (NADP+) [Rhodanobacter sp. ANJX3]
MQPIRTGLIGYGAAGATFHAPLIAVEPRLQLARIASSRRDAIARAFPEVHIDDSPEALIESAEVDLVVIATPNETHYPLALAALRAGKHVVIDKPFAVTVAQAETLVAESEKRGLRLSVFQNRRWDGDFLTVADLIHRDVLGSINYVESHFDRFRPAIKQGWREQAKPGSGVFVDLGAHLIDQALQLFGMPEAVTADIAIQREQAQIDDYFHVVLRYGRRRVVLHASMLAAAPGPRFTVHGSLGSLIITGLDGQEAALKAGKTPSGSNWGSSTYTSTAVLTRADEDEKENIEVAAGNYPCFYRGMAAAIADEGDVPVSPRQALDAMRIIELTQRSASEGRTIALP